MAIPEPETPRLDSPHPSWKRLCIAPFHYQADEWNDKIYPAAADFQWTLRQFEQRFPIRKLDVDKKAGALLVEFPLVVNSRRVEKLASQYRVYPAEVRGDLGLEFPTWDPLPDGFGHEFAHAVEDLWRSMELGFRNAIRGRFCRILARIGSPVETKFTEITPDSFSHFKITDWFNGVASTSSGYEIFSIYAADSVEHQPHVSSPLQAYRAALSRKPVMQWVVAYVLKRYPVGKDRVSYDALTAEIAVAMTSAKRSPPPNEKTVRDGYKLAMEIAPYIRATGKTGIGMLGLPNFPEASFSKRP